MFPMSRPGHKSPSLTCLSPSRTIPASCRTRRCPAHSAASPSATQPPEEHNQISITPDEQSESIGNACQILKNPHTHHERKVSCRKEGGRRPPFFWNFPVRYPRKYRNHRTAMCLRGTDPDRVRDHVHPGTCLPASLQGNASR